MQVEHCKDLIQGSATAALTRVCMTANTRNKERRVYQLKSLWCESQEFRDRVQSCVDYKWKTMPIKPWRKILPYGTLRSALLTIKCLEKSLNWTLV